MLKASEKRIGGNAGGHNLAVSANGKNAEGLDDAKKAILAELERVLGAKAERI